MTGRLQRAISELATIEGQAINDRYKDGKVTWLVPSLPINPAEHQPASPLPHDYRTLATDGSHIDADRHLPVRCAMINISKVVLQYGSEPQARLESNPKLHTGARGLSLLDPQGPKGQPLEGQLLGIKRSVDEVIALAELAQEAMDHTPTLALIDGSLILWGLTGQTYPEYVRQALLDQGLLPALDRLHEIALHHPLALAAYVSLPRSTELVNALRLAICPYDPVDCDQRCSKLPSGQGPPCDAVGGLMDREVLTKTLAPGERSAVFKSTSSIVQKYYREHTTAFYYINTGEEIARIEVPLWVAQDKAMLSLTHTLILDQCRKGLGYPVAIMEAHEQAVIGGAERDLFRQMVEEMLAERQLPVYTSEKARSKRLRWL